MVKVFVLQEGWSIPITFRPRNSILPKDASVPSTVFACTLVVALHNDADQQLKSGEVVFQRSLKILLFVL